MDAQEDLDFIAKQIASDAAEHTKMAERLDAIISNPKSLPVILSHISNGGSFVTLAALWKVRYSDLVNWIYIQHYEAYGKAMEARREWEKESILREIRSIGLCDIRDAYNPDGSLKDMQSMPDALARALAQVETDDLFEGTGKDRERVGYTKKIKLYDKIKALELLGRESNGMFAQKHEVKGKVTLEDLVAGSNGGSNEAASNDASPK